MAWVGCVPLQVEILMRLKIDRAKTHPQTSLKTQTGDTSSSQSSLSKQLITIAIFRTSCQWDVKRWTDQCSAVQCSQLRRSADLVGRRRRVLLQLRQLKADAGLIQSRPERRRLGAPLSGQEPAL